MIEVIKQISPDDAMVFTELVKNGGQLTYENNAKEKTLFSLENLKFLGLIEKAKGEKMSTYNITLFGQKFASTALPGVEISPGFWCGDISCTLCEDSATRENGHD